MNGWKERSCTVKSNLARERAKSCFWSLITAFLNCIFFLGILATPFRSVKFLLNPVYFHWDKSKANKIPEKMNVWLLPPPNFPEGCSCIDCTLVISLSNVISLDHKRTVLLFRIHSLLRRQYTKDTMELINGNRFSNLSYMGSNTVFTSALLYNKIMPRIKTCEKYLHSNKRSKFRY